MKKQTILFLTSNPSGTDRLALDQEARAVQLELERSGFRDRFELVTRWAAEPLDLLRELRKLKPTVVHFSGHGAPDTAGKPRSGQVPHRDVVGETGHDNGEPRPGLFFQRADGSPQLVSTAALEETFGAAGASVKLVVLNACYSEEQAEALLTHVDCIVGMSGAIRDDVARSFAIGFYGGLGERESIAAAYKQGCAAISLEGLPDSNRPQLKIRAGVDADQPVPTAAISPKPLSINKTSIAIGSGLLLLGALAYTESREHRKLSTSLTAPFDTTSALKIDDVIIREAKSVDIDDASHKASNSDDRSDRSSSEPSTTWRIVLDVRIRNNGSSTVNLTKATLKVVREVQQEAGSFPSANYEPSAVYKMSPKRFISPGQEAPPTSPGSFHARALPERARLSEESFPVAHSLKPGDVDSFIIEANVACNLEVQLILLYNGNLTVASREISFACR